MSFDLQPTLPGSLVELRPLRPGDFDALYAVARDPGIWELHPEPDRYKEDVFRGFFRGAMEKIGGVRIGIMPRTPGAHDGIIFQITKSHAHLSD